MRVGIFKKIIILTVISTITAPVFAESLFQAGASYNSTQYIQPRSLFSSVKAKSIGDLVTILVNEQVKTSDSVKLTLNKNSSTTDGFSSAINKIAKAVLNTSKNVVPSELSTFGGTNAVGNTASSARTSTFTDTITAQVVQILPNGNLVVQGKKTSVQAGERVDIVMSGIIDPRFLNATGQIQSSQVANLQLSVAGKGSMSNTSNEGAVNKYIRYLF